MPTVKRTMLLNHIEDATLVSTLNFKDKYGAEIWIRVKKNDPRHDEMMKVFKAGDMLEISIYEPEAATNEY